ncbi:hypothetical protein LTR36_007021 [Oleoguttula mirabilis]|uniref:Fungal N-terminal domain-containing protein n=1 Tax=Oleoguttula mirabilis TaxID=1507867 RepID=A0AAV9JBN2_9PEZI|nr:hypothetical protein LTR36_007021 [Oleoguttula mirabilis]
MAEVSSALGAISNAFSLTLKITEKVYEIVAVDQEAKDLLETTDQINNQLAHGKKLRRQKSGLLSSDEKDLVDKIFASTEKAVSTVASLIEPARADMIVSGGRVRLSTRIQFVFRDQAHLPVNLAKLGIAGGNLNMALGVLCNKTGHSDGPSWKKPSLHDLKPPPTYNESEWLYASRQKNLRRRASAVTLNESYKPCRANLQPSSASIAELPDDSASMWDGENVTAVSDNMLLHPPFDDAGSIRSCPESPIIITPPEEKPQRLTGRARNRSWLEYQAQRG